MRGAAVHEVCENQFFCLFILLFVCHHLPAAPDRPAGPVVSPFPSPAAHHSRSRVTLTGWTEENLEEKHKEGKNEEVKEEKKKGEEIRREKYDFNGMQPSLCPESMFEWR